MKADVLCTDRFQDFVVRSAESVRIMHCAGF